VQNPERLSYSRSFYKFKLIGLLLIATALGGCAMVGPEFSLPPTELSDSWSAEAKEGLSTAVPEQADWWKAFNDPGLNLLIEEAYQQNLDLQMAGLRILEARAKLGIATGTLYPQQQRATAGFGAAGGSRNAANTFGGDMRYTDSSVGFDAAWELDIWGKFRRGIQAADNQLLATIADYDTVLVSLTGEVARTYILIRTLEERIRVAENNVSGVHSKLQKTVSMAGW